MPVGEPPVPLARRIHSADRNKRIRIRKTEQSEACRHAMAEQWPLPGRMAVRIVPPHLRADQIICQIAFDGTAKTRDMTFRIGLSEKFKNFETATLWPVNVMEPANLTRCSVHVWTCLSGLIGKSIEAMFLTKRRSHVKSHVATQTTVCMAGSHLQPIADCRKRLTATAIMEHINQFLTCFILFIAALLTLRVVVWFFEHDKEYWLIFAHVLPFMPVIVTGTVVLIFIKSWLFREFGSRHPE